MKTVVKWPRRDGDNKSNNDNYAAANEGNVNNNNDMSTGEG